MAIRVNILDVLMAEAHRTCSRCSQGHVPTPDDGGDYVHGVDHVGGEVYAPPEPCPASPLWRVAELLRLQDEADQRLRTLAAGRKASHAPR
jgi:hypothetical protein